MQTFSNLFDETLRKKLEAEITELQRMLGEGNAPDYAAYRYEAGRIEGLASAIAFCDEVQTELNKQ